MNAVLNENGFGENGIWAVEELKNLLYTPQNKCNANAMQFGRKMKKNEKIPNANAKPHTTGSRRNLAMSQNKINRRRQN